jgi:hypothetical protein
MLVATAMAIGGAAPAAASRAGCFENAPSGATKANKHSESDDAIVLRAHGKYYGCSFDREDVNELDGQDKGEKILRGSVQVERRNAAYGSVLNGRDVTVYSARLRKSHTWASSEGSGYGENVTLDDLVLRGNGSIAWQFTYPGDDTGAEDAFTVVLGLWHDGRDHRFHTYDDDQDSQHGRDHRIVRGSLELHHDGAGPTGWRVYWSREGEATRHEPIY